MKAKLPAKGLIILGIIAVVYSVVVFALPFFERNVIFWLSYAFTLLALVVQIYVMKVAFLNGKDARSRFYGFPIARVGIIYFVAQLVLGLVFMILAKTAPAWLPVVLYVVLLGVAAIGFIGTDVVRVEIERQDRVLKASVSTMRSLQSKAAFIVGQCDDSAAKSELQKLSDALRYSDPVSSDATMESEANLAAYIDDLQSAVMDRDYQNTHALCSRIEMTLAERNRLCKVNK